MATAEHPLEPKRLRRVVLGRPMASHQLEDELLPISLALPLLEAVEHAALRGGVPVDARIEKGRTPTHALRRLWEVEHFDWIVAPASSTGGGGFTTKEVAWILDHSPSETVLLKPAPAPV